MPKHDPIQEALEQAGRLRSARGEAELEKELRAFLRHRSNLVVAKAAKIARERRVAAVVPELVVAFRRLMADPARLDKRCEAVTEIAGALYEMDYAEPEVYRAGLRHVQLEGSFGPPVDVAAHLRGICALGLTRTSHPAALEDVVELLQDREALARIGAVRALATNGGTAGTLALRLKVLTGDREPDVIAECFAGLLGSHTESSVDFVSRYMDADDGAIAEAAILALGVSRSSKAAAALKEKWKRTSRGRLKSTLVLALTSSRSEDALTFVLEELEAANPAVASEILAALAGQRPSASIRQMIQAAVGRRGDAQLEQQYRSAFGVDR